MKYSQPRGRKLSPQLRTLVRTAVKAAAGKKARRRFNVVRPKAPRGLEQTQDRLFRTLRDRERDGTQLLARLQRQQVG